MTGPGDFSSSLRPDDWTVESTCHKAGDPDDWYAPKAAEQRYAAALCRVACPVMDQCGDRALRDRERSGVWGGMTERELISVQRRLGDREWPGSPERVEDRRLPNVEGLALAEALHETKGMRMRAHPALALIASDRKERPRKEACGNGHAMTDENTGPNNVCRTCKREATQRVKAKREAARQAAIETRRTA